MNLDKFYRDNHNQQVARIRKTMSYNKHMAEDIVQEAYLRAVKYSGSFDKERATMNAWFNGILYNSLRDAFSKNKEKTEELDDKAQPLIEALDYELLVRGISEVQSEDSRRILYLYYILGYTGREINEIEGESSVTNITSTNSKFKKYMIGKYGVEI